MGTTHSPLAFEDCRLALDRALESAKGLLIKFHSRQEAERFRARANKFRSLDRANNAKIYPEDALMHYNSEYDKLVLSIPKDEPWRVEIRLRTIEHLQIEEIE